MPAGETQNPAFDSTSCFPLFPSVFVVLSTLGVDRPAVVGSPQQKSLLSLFAQDYYRTSPETSFFCRCRLEPGNDICVPYNRLLNTLLHERDRLVCRGSARSANGPRKSDFSSLACVIRNRVLVLVFQECILRWRRRGRNPPQPLPCASGIQTRFTLERRAYIFSQHPEYENEIVQYRRVP